MGEVKAPAGLGPRGRRLWRAVTGNFELNDSETALLTEATRVVDDVERLQADLADAPATVPGSRGQMTVHPLRAELRNQRLLLAKLLAQLDMPSCDSEGNPWDGLTTSQRARKAARARWDKRGGVR